MGLYLAKVCLVPIVPKVPVVPNISNGLNPDSAVERKVMSKEQTFRSEDMPFGIANGKSQILKYGICNLRYEIPSASEDKLLQVCSQLTF
jgi:hypothetical protein